MTRIARIGKVHAVRRAVEEGTGQQIDALIGIRPISYLAAYASRAVECTEDGSMAKSPSTNGANGRDTKGRFAAGNSGGPGNPHARQVARIRSQLLSMVSEDDLREVLQALIQRARTGDVAAVHELLNRLVGKPATAIDPRQEDWSERRMKLAESGFELDEEMHEEKLWDF